MNFFEIIPYLFKILLELIKIVMICIEVQNKTNNEATNQLTQIHKLPFFFRPTVLHDPAASRLVKNTMWEKLGAFGAANSLTTQLILNCPLFFIKIDEDLIEF